MADAVSRFDAAIVGAGPVGCVCAISLAHKGAKVALLEADPDVRGRFAGEWLHPPAAKMLRDIGIDVDRIAPKSGIGFAVLPGDGSDPILLPYSGGSQGIVCEHATLVLSLREAVQKEANVEFISYARVSAVEDGRITFSKDGSESTIGADRIVGADGRASIVRRSLGLSLNPIFLSRSLGITLHDASLPFEGYGHVVLGGPGPIFLYRLANGAIRVHLDVPFNRWTSKNRKGFLSEAYGRLLPGDLRSAFVEALHVSRVHATINQVKPRITYGTPRRVLIGDAAGHYHPMTAVGMTLGMGDVQALCEIDDFRGFVSERFRAVRVPEFLAMGLYEVLSDYRTESVMLRSAVYQGWRASPTYRDRTMRILACERLSTLKTTLTFCETVVRALAREVIFSIRRLAWRRTWTTFRALAIRLWWLTLGMIQLRNALREGREESAKTREYLAKAFPFSINARTKSKRTSRKRVRDPPNATSALGNATERLIQLQREDGGWEGEMVWCPMLTAQYALLHHIIGRPLDPERRRRVLLSFERTRLQEGSWGLHEHSPPHLFVTALVYVAARLSGAGSDDPLIVPARRFIQTEGILGIPSWGKFWLAILNLYDWNGVNAVLPELWNLPRKMPLHPSNWYCHTRLIYMAMASIHGRRFQVPVTPVIVELREELFPQGFTKVNFTNARNRLRDADLFARPSVWLRTGYGIVRLVERFHSKRLRERCIESILRQIRWELQATSHTSISPVSGILNILSLWLHDSDDSDCWQAFSKLEDWVWDDEDKGLRVTGARSASWDTGFTLQALASLPETPDVSGAIERGAEFLLGEQIKTSLDQFHEAFRVDPKGGWCFAGGWHGWPVSDCTAEAVLGLIAAHGNGVDPTVLGNAADFMLRIQNPDGGFGTYEAKRTDFGLEWMNPAEMFGESMTEHSFVECTASCIAALAVCRDRIPEIGDRSAVADSIIRGALWLRRNQTADGSWRGVWGVQYIYGTLFGIRGLVADGASPTDPALRTACRWLLKCQRKDGGWGEHHSGCLSGRYVPHEQSQVIQTSWALIALLEAGESDWAAISRGAGFLIDTQDADGTWPKQDMAGVFFRTALVDYVLYRQYFPMHALGLYERCRRKRLVTGNN